jgi:hypothetical protein
MLRTMTRERAHGCPIHARSERQTTVKRWKNTD